MVRCIHKSKIVVISLMTIKILDTYLIQKSIVKKLIKKKPPPCHLLLAFGLVQHIYASPNSILPDSDTNWFSTKLTAEFTKNIRTQFSSITSSIGPKSRTSFFSVGINLTLTFCNCRTLSLKAES